MQKTMARRALFWVGLILFAVVASLASMAAETPRTRHVGLLAPADHPCEEVEQQFGTNLAKLGWLPGRDLVFDCLYAPRLDELPELAATLASHNPDVIWTTTGAGVRAARAATTSIPIVMYAPDPVRLGLVASLARPGGNVTGLADPIIELIGKRIEIARETIPNLHRIAVIGVTNLNPGATGIALLEEFSRLGAATGIEFRIHSLGQADDIQVLLAWVKSETVDAVYITSNPRLMKNAPTVVAGVTDLGLPVIGDQKAWPEAGALIGYFPDPSTFWLRNVDYVNRILRGANPAELPVQQPAKLVLVINLKTAKTLGITVPRSILARTDEVIE
jgi:putative ABC transport system substrate-binding protein